MMTKIGILISGRGSNMMSIVAACGTGTIPGEVALVVSNRADAAGIQWAEEHGLATAILSHKDFTNREDHDRAIVGRLVEVGVEWVCLAGYMRLLSQPFIEAFPNRILNIHPALLPSFPGLHAQKQAFEYGVKTTGCTVHFIDSGVDTGPIVLQESVSVMEDDDEESMSKRILAVEHKIYSQAIRLFFENRLKLRERKVIIL